MNNCIICKGIPSPRSYSTSERLRFSQFLIVFKLFELLKIECDDETALCEACYMLLDRIDCLGNELHEKTQEFKSRFDQGQVQPRVFNYSSLSNPCKRKEDSQDDNPCKRQKSVESIFLKPKIETQSEEDHQNSLETIFVPSKIENQIQSESSEGDPSKEIDESFLTSNVSTHDLAEESIQRFQEKTLKHSPEEIPNEPEEDREENGSNKKRKQSEIDYNISYITSMHGSDLLVYQDHLYEVGRKAYQCIRIRWRCLYYYDQKKKKMNCPGRISTPLDKSFVYLDSKREHNHPPPTDRINKTKLRNRLCQIAIEHPKMSVPEVIAFVHFDYPGGIPFKIPHKGLIGQMICRARKRERQKQLKNEKTN